jgi:hypothetical protein
MLTVVGLLVYTVIQRQVRLYLRDHDQQVPGNKGLTATPTAAAVFALFTPVRRVHCAVEGICLRWDSWNTTAVTQKCTACPSLAARGFRALKPLWYNGVPPEVDTPHVQCRRL